MANVFISHSSKDKRFATRIARDLRAAGYDPWFDVWKINIGDPIVSEVQAGITAADFVILVLTPEALASGWVEQEWRVAYWLEIKRRNVVVLPILLKPCTLPLFLQDKLYADFTKEYVFGFAQIIRAIEHHEVSAELRRARLTGIFNSYDGDRVPWEALFRRSRRIRLLFTYARSWREKNDRLLHAFVARAGTRVEVVLPNPDDEIIMTALQHQFEPDGSNVGDKVRRAIRYYEELGKRRNGAVAIHLMNRIPAHAIYMFDDKVVVTLNSNLPGRREVPTFSADRGGDLYEFFEDEIRNVERLFPATGRHRRLSHSAPAHTKRARTRKTA